MSKERLKEKEENQYRAKVDKIFDKYKDEHGFMQIPISEDAPPPADGDWWGPWRYDVKRLVLEYYEDTGKFGYEVDLERCSNKDEVLDWIFHLDEKNWCGGSDCMGQFVAAICDLLGPIRNLGIGKSLDVGSCLRKRK